MALAVAAVGKQKMKRKKRQITLTQLHFPSLCRFFLLLLLCPGARSKIAETEEPWRTCLSSSCSSSSACSSSGSPPSAALFYLTWRGALSKTKAGVFLRLLRAWESRRIGVGCSGGVQFPWHGNHLRIPGKQQRHWCSGGRCCYALGCTRARIFFFKGKHRLGLDGFESVKSCSEKDSLFAWLRPGLCMINLMPRGRESCTQMNKSIHLHVVQHTVCSIVTYI